MSVHLSQIIQMGDDMDENVVSAMNSKTTHSMLVTKFFYSSTEILENMVDLSKLSGSPTISPT